MQAVDSLTDVLIADDFGDFGESYFVGREPTQNSCFACSEYLAPQLETVFCPECSTASTLLFGHLTPLDHNQLYTLKQFSSARLFNNSFEAKGVI